MKTAIMFSGQGAQCPGMMRDIVAEHHEAKEIFDLASALLERDIYSLTMDSTQEELNRTQNTQPCLLACELAALRVFRKIGLRYEAAVGFSLGEWAALAACKAVSEQDVLQLIEKRASVMQCAVPIGEGAMAAVLGKDEKFVLQLCQSIGDVTPANYNCPGNITVAGTASAVERLLEKAAAQGVTTVRLSVSIPSHCALMDPAAAELTPAIEGLALQVPQTVFVMNATGKPAANSAEIKNNLIRQLTRPVMFQQSIEYLLDSGYEVFVEIGPGKTLSGMVKRTAKQAGKKVKIMQFNDSETVQAVSDALV